MSRPARLLRLIQALRSLPAPVTAARLAGETEVSERTLYRDIASLRAAGAVIDGAPGVGYTLTEDPALPPQSFTRLEIEALVLALGELRARGDRAMVAAGEAALSKIIATLPEAKQRQALHAVVQVHRFGQQPVADLELGIYRQACWDETALDILYRDRDGAVTERRIWPLSIVYSDAIVYLLAWCVLRQGFRQFHIIRVQQVRATDESFRPRRVTLLRSYLAYLRGYHGRVISER